MSNKTMKQRIALVAVSALTAGFLSVVSMPAANAAVTATASIARGDYDWSTAVADSFGQCDAPSDASADADQTGEILVSGGTFALALDSTVADIQMDVLNDQISFVISGPARWDSYTADADGPATASFADKVLTFTATNTTAVDSAPLLVKGKVTGAGSIQVSVVVNDGGTSTTIERYTLTASTACITGAAATSNSIVKVMAYGTDETAITTNTTETEDATLSGAYTTNFASSADRIANGGTAYIGVRVKDATTAAGAVTTQGVFSATATNGAVIGWDATGLALGASTATTAGPASGVAQTEKLLVTQGTANENKPVTTTVSIYFNSVLYGTRSITFTGKAASLVVLPAYSSIAKAGTTAKYALAYEIVDSAGNKLTSEGPGVDGSAAFSTSAGENNPVVATSGTVVDPTQAIVTGVSTPNAESTGFVGTANVTCGTGSGTAKVYLKYVYSDLTSIVSSNYDMPCAYGIANYKASLDKASYTPGEIATLTITATDKNGKAVYDVDATPDNEDLGSASYPVSVSMAGMTAVTAPTNVDEFTGGKKTYKFTVGTTEGSFAGIVDLPLYNSTTYAQVAQTVSYKIAGSGAVTNADVLKSIVALIASINKQIQALQKLILKR